MRHESHANRDSAPYHDERREPHCRPQLPNHNVGWELEDDVWDEEDHGQDRVSRPNRETQVIVHPRNSGLVIVKFGTRLDMLRMGLHWVSLRGQSVRRHR
jgi:hypothetical protein